MQRVPVEVDPAVLAVAGDEDASVRMVAVGQRDAGVGRGADRRRHPRADLEGNPVLGERLDLLAAAAEKERVAALQPEHALAFLREAHQSALISSCGNSWFSGRLPT